MKNRALFIGAALIIIVIGAAILIPIAMNWIDRINNPPNIEGFEIWVTVRISRDASIDGSVDMTGEIENIDILEHYTQDGQGYYYTLTVWYWHLGTNHYYVFDGTWSTEHRQLLHHFSDPGGLPLTQVYPIIVPDSAVLMAELKVFNMDGVELVIDRISGNTPALPDG